MRRRKKIAIIAGTILVFYSLIGFIAIPLILESILPDKMSEALKRPVSISNIRLNPFALTAAVEGLDIKAKNTTDPFVSFDELFVNIQTKSLLKLGLVAKEVRLAGPDIHLARISDTEFNFSDLIPEKKPEQQPEAEEPETDSEPFQFSISNISVIDGNLTFQDEPFQKTHTISPINFTLPLISNFQKLIDKKLQFSNKSLTENKAKKIFNLFNIPVVEEKLTDIDEKNILKACQQTGFPIVLKAVSSSILHKTESGLVHVGLSHENQVLDAVKDMKTRTNGSIENFLVQPVVAGKREFVAGMFKDSEFGPVIVFGLGGILTEALEDVVFKIAPLNDADMEDMFDQISSKKLLNDFRGEKKVDKKAVKAVLKALSDLALAYPDIKEQTIRLI